MKKIATATIFAIALSASPVSAQSAFQGFHIGINAGPAMSDVEASASGSKLDLATQGFVGGGSAGYVFSLSPEWLIDAEAIIDYTSSSADIGGAGKIEQGLGYGGALSLGYMITSHNAIYGKAGIEMQDFKVLGADKSIMQGLAGVGTRWAMDGNWSAKAEYNYLFPTSATTISGIDIKPSSSVFRIGVDYRFR